MPKLSEVARNRATDAVCALLNGGALRLFDARGVELAVLTFASPAFQPAIDGRAIARQIADDKEAKADGKAVEYRAFSTSGEQIMSGGISPSLQVRKNYIVGLDEFVYEQNPIQG